MLGGVLTALTALTCVYLFTHLFKRQLDRRQIRLSLFTISYSSSSLNRIFSRVGKRYLKFLRPWFTCGIAVAAMLAISISYILVRELVNAAVWLYGLTRNKPAADESGAPGLALELVLPGVTVPWAHALYLWIATAVSLGVHEAGHALAAAAEGIGIHAVSFFLLLLLPGAYVTLNTDNLAVLGLSRALNVICAGVWHNVVLCCLCWLLASALPLSLMPLYSTKIGAVVRHVPPGSSLHGHLHRGDTVISVNGCPVTSCGDWISCVMRDSPGSHLTQQLSPVPLTWTPHQMLRRSMRVVPQLDFGYCIPLAEQLAANTCSTVSGGSECGSSQLCFTLSGNSSADIISDLGLLQSDYVEESPEDGVCLSARSVASNEACRAGNRGTCRAGELCMQPVLASDEHLFKVCLRRYRMQQRALPEHWAGSAARLRAREDADMAGEGGTVEDDVIFVGSQGALLGAVEVSNYLPRLGLFALGLPRALEQLLEYTFRVSAALALINMAPVIYFDGQAALNVLIVYIGGRLGEDQSLKRLRWLQRGRRWLLCYGTGSLISIIAVHALQLLGVEHHLQSSLNVVMRALPYISRKFLS